MPTSGGSPVPTSGDSMTIRDALHEGTALLSSAGIDTPWLDASLLLGHVLGITKERLYASLPDELPAREYGRYREILTRRAAGIPVSYLRNRKEFFGLSFHVDSRVLVPRPDTETLVESALRILDREPGLRRVHDCCTGSGCIPITLKHERPDLEVSASDISREAAEVFRINCREILGRELPFHTGHLLSGAEGPYDLITANPPYLTRSETDAMEAGGWPEPRIALDGGEDGLDLVRELIGGGMDYLSPTGYLIVEISSSQAQMTRELFFKGGYADIEIVSDLAGRDRVVLARRGV